jgi:hypothetical protein
MTKKGGNCYATDHAVQVVQNPTFHRLPSGFYLCVLLEDLHAVRQLRQGTSSNSHSFRKQSTEGDVTVHLKRLPRNCVQMMINLHSLNAV